MKCEVVTIKVPLYTYDEDGDGPRRMTNEEAQEAFDAICFRDDSIWSIESNEEEIIV